MGTSSVSKRTVEKRKIKRKGDEFCKKFVGTELAEQLEQMNDDLTNSWRIKDARLEITVNGESHKTMTIIPNKGDLKTLNPYKFFYAVDHDTRELLLNTTKGWIRTEYVMRFS